MFRRLLDIAETAASVTIMVDGRGVPARVGDTVAAALIAADHLPTRISPVSGAPRAPYCMMGVCFECLMVIDGAANRQGCLVTVRDGMTVTTLKGRRPVDSVADDEGRSRDHE